MSWPFKNKQQLEAVKELPLTKEKLVENRLALSDLRIGYSVSRRKPYYAEIGYKEHPTDWDNHGTEQNDSLEAESWPELIDKVIAYFEGVK